MINGTWSGSNSGGHFRKCPPSLLCTSANLGSPKGATDGPLQAVQVGTPSGGRWVPNEGRAGCWAAGPENAPVDTQASVCGCPFEVRVPETDRERVRTRARVSRTADGFIFRGAGLTL